jgi:hypothetical protein
VTIEGARQLVVKTLELMKDFQPFVQHFIFENYLGHVLLKNEVLKYINNLASFKFNQEVLNNMKSRIIENLVSSRPIQLVVTKDIVCMLATSSASIGSGRAIVKVLGVNNQNIGRPWSDRHNWIHKKMFFGLFTRGEDDLMPCFIKDIVIQFWTTQTTISPNQKDVVKQ